MEFEFATTPLVVFGARRLEALAGHAAALGHRALLVTGSRTLERAGVFDRVERSLAETGVSAVRVAVHGEPDTVTVDAGVRTAVESACDVVIAIGGGSALDVGKAIASLIANGGEALDYLEVVGRGRPIERPSVPFVAVPTTAGTGSEATRNAVIADSASGTKASIRHLHLLPRIAILDPALAAGAPPPVTAGSGLDALVQLIEPYVSRREHPLVDCFARSGMRRAAAALPRAYADAADVDARAELMLAAHLSGIALAHCGLGAAHALAGPLGGAFPIPHGMACAATIADVMDANVRVAARDGVAVTVRRYADVAEALGEARGADDLALARRGIERVRALCRALTVPPLASYGVTRASIPDLVARARRTSSMKANPVELSDEDLGAILERAIG